jgi:endoglucanase
MLPSACPLILVTLLAVLPKPSGGNSLPGTDYRPDHRAKYDYGAVIAESLLFYEAQRSGKLPDNNRIPWRGDSALEDAVVGGYYDAGDHVKFGFPMAATTTVLAWAGISFQNGFDQAGQLGWLKETIR